MPNISVLEIYYLVLLVLSVIVVLCSVPKIAVYVVRYGLKPSLPRSPVDKYDFEPAKDLSPLEAGLIDSGYIGSWRVKKRLVALAVAWLARRGYLRFKLEGGKLQLLSVKLEDLAGHKRCILKALSSGGFELLKRKLPKIYVEAWKDLVSRGLAPLDAEKMFVACRRASSGIVWLLLIFACFAASLVFMVIGVVEPSGVPWLHLIIYAFVGMVFVEFVAVFITNLLPHLTLKGEEMWGILLMISDLIGLDRFMFEEELEEPGAPAGWIEGGEKLTLLEALNLIVKSL